MTRYIKLAYCDGSGELYQIHDDAGEFVRFADLDGTTIRGAFQATMTDANAPLPAWASDAERIVQREALKIDYKAAVRSGAVVDGETATWKAEVALE